MSAPDAAEAELRAAALDLALHQGSLRSPEAVAGFRASSGGHSWVLLDGQGNPLARLPRPAVVRQVERRRQRLDQLLSNARRRGVSATHWRTALRQRSWEVRAQAWGLSAHQPVPEPVFTGRRLAIAGALLLLGLVPGLLYLGSLLLQRFRRHRALRALVRAWTFRGRPDPLEKGWSSLPPSPDANHSANEGPI